MEFTKEDENKLGQILKELNEMKDVLKGGEGSGVKGHRTPAQLRYDEINRQSRERRSKLKEEPFTFTPNTSQVPLSQRPKGKRPYGT